jgi:hypothetical protein
MAMMVVAIALYEERGSLKRGVDRDIELRRESWVGIMTLRAIEA